MNRTQIAEATVRMTLRNRETWMLLYVWEMTEVIRDTHDAPPALIESAAQFIDWTIDELDARFPSVLPRFHALTDAGHMIDLQGLYAYEYARSTQCEQ